MVSSSVGDMRFMCKYWMGKSTGKHHFIGCSNWSDGDDLSHGFTKIPPQVHESILRSLFRGEEIAEEDTEVVEVYCSTIIHPSHLPQKKECARIHYQDNKSVIGHLEVQTCPQNFQSSSQLMRTTYEQSSFPRLVSRITTRHLCEPRPHFTSPRNTRRLLRLQGKLVKLPFILIQVQVFGFMSASLNLINIVSAASTRALLDGKPP
ncbi:hypothetical protein C8J57DRAFT_1397456 [Mycena rebaudengoi]|nr:hypothetical protein C8J57DRAFT_1397456 [Mycena rebaudengoi]